jgi:4-hydroxybenzoate polyprenyltransferase
MIAFLRLIRFPNLLIIILTQYLIRYCLILPAFTAEYYITGVFPQHLSDVYFALLVFSTVLIAAGGYIINDEADLYIDEINKPTKVVLGKRVSFALAKTAYWTMTMLGVLTGLFLGVFIQKPVIGFVHVFAAISLWMYSAQLKKKMLTGNILIAFLSALTLLIVGLFEPRFYPNFISVLVYSAFAFLVSLIREIIKDIEDVEGDEKGQVKSLPVRIGIKQTKGIVLLLIIITGWLLGNTLYRSFYTNTVFNFWNILIFCELPFLALLYLISTAKDKKDFHVASTFAKIIMLLGILSMVPLFYFFIR